MFIYKHSSILFIYVYMYLFNTFFFKAEGTVFGLGKGLTDHQP